MDPFTEAYIEAALWSSMDNATDQGGDPLDANYGLEDIAPETLIGIQEDCEAFQRDHAGDISGDVERAGHDFWDGDWQDDIGQRLTEASHVYGTVDLYVGDDGLIYA